MQATTNPPPAQALADLAVDLGLQPGDPEYIRFLAEVLAECEGELRRLGALVTEIDEDDTAF